MPKWIAESILSLSFLVLGIIFWVASAPLVGRSPHLIGPAHLPRAASVLIILFALANLSRVISQRAKNCDKLIPNIRVIVGTALFASYLYLIPVLGYFYVTPVFAACIMLLLEYRKPLQVILLSGGFTLVAYIVFFRLMSVRLPV